LALLLLLGVLATAYYNVIFLGQTLVASSDYHPFDYRWDVIKTGATTNAFVNWHDLGGVWWQWEPAGSFFSQAYREGRVPLWDPTLAGGVDTHVSLVQGQYYPPYVALLLLGNVPWMRDLYYLLELFIAGLFCYLLLRRNNCSHIAAVCMGTSYMLGGALTQTINSILGQSFAILPLMVWSLDYAVSKPSWRRIAIAGLLLGTCVLSSFLPIVISGFVLAALYLTVSTMLHSQKGTGINARDTLDHLGPPVTAIVIALLLAGFLIVPVESASIRDATFAKWYVNIGLAAFAPDQFLELFSPSLTFDVWQSRDPSTLLFTKKYEGGCFYVGLATIVLAFLARPGKTPQQRRLFFFFLAGTVVISTKLFGLPPSQWMGHFPVLNNIHFVPYFCGAFGFCLSGLAGLGVESLIVHRSKSMIAMSALVMLVFGAMVIRFAQIEPLTPTLAGPLLWSALTKTILESGRMVLVGAGLLFVISMRVVGMRGSHAANCALVVIAVELVPLACRDRFLRSDVWKHPPRYVTWLQQDHDLFRAHGIHDLALTPNVSQGVNIACISSRTPFNSERYSELVRKYFVVPEVPYPLVKSVLPSRRGVLDLLNVKYILLYSPAPAEVAQITAAGLLPAFEDGNFRIYRNPTVWPRSFVARTVRTANGGADSLQSVATGGPYEAVIEGLGEPSNAPMEGSVESIRDDFDSVVIKAHASAPAFLILSENASPGWQATVRGVPAHIYIANHAFQAVEIPAGVSEIRFRYRTPGLTLGIFLSGLGLAIALGMLALPALQRFRQSRQLRAA